MINFIQNQLEVADRMVALLENDHRERMEMINVWVQINQSLIKKLEQRDETIAKLRAQLAEYEAKEPA